MKIVDDLLEGVIFDRSPHIGGRYTPRFIVMHYTAGASALSSVRAIRNRGLSAHLFVERDGSIIQTVPFTTIAFHAGPSDWRGFTGLNRHAIGIEIANIGFLDVRGASGWTREGLGRTFGEDKVIVAAHKNGGRVKAWERFPEAQIHAVMQITQALLGTYPTIQEVVGHDDIAPTRKSDPGPAFPMERFQSIGGGAAGSGNLAANDLGLFEVIGRDTLNLRGGAGTAFKILKSMPPGTTMRVLREEGAWRMVDLQGDGEPDGFVHGGFIRRIGD